MEWISVNDRLPEIDMLVLIATHVDGVTIMYNDGKEWRYSDGSPLLKPLIVTHWMPLPEPPKEATP